MKKLLLFLILTQAGFAYTASFDCNKATSISEKLICSDQQLSQLDSERGKLYAQVKVRIITLGSNGAKVEEHGKPTITVGVPQEEAKIDPTGVGDAFRSGFLAGLSWGVGHERAAQIGSMLATYCIESKGTQEYRFDREGFLKRFSAAYGEAAASDIHDHLHPRLIG